jgi:dihydroorotase
MSSQLGLIGSPSSAETSMLARNILLTEEFGGHLHVSHISTERSVDIIRSAKKRGIKVTAETSPQYFVLDDDCIYNYNSLVKVNPPLRNKKDVQAIIKGIQDGTIDVISSDHKPNTIDSKDVEFDIASFGISSLETSFPLAYTYLVDAGYITLEQLIEKMCFKPADIITISKGNIAIGSDADLMIFHPNEEFEVEANNFKSKAKYSPYDGFKLKGKVKYTIVNGKIYDLTI